MVKRRYAGGKKKGSWINQVAQFQCPYNWLTGMAVPLETLTPSAGVLLYAFSEWLELFWKDHTKHHLSIYLF